MIYYVPSSVKSSWMGEGGRVRQQEIGRDRDIARSELRHNRQGRPSAQLNELACIALNEKCETVSRQNQWPRRFAEGRPLKRPKSSVCSVPWNMTYGTAKTEIAEFFFFFQSLKSSRFLWEAWFLHKDALWEYHTSMEVSSHNPQEAFSASCLLLGGCHRIHSPFPDRCL